MDTKRGPTASLYKLLHKVGLDHWAIVPQNHDHIQKHFSNWNYSSAKVIIEDEELQSVSRNGRRTRANSQSMCRTNSQSISISATIPKSNCTIHPIQ